MRHTSFSLTVMVAATVALGAPLRAQTPEVIFCEIPASPKSVIPGAVDSGGSPTTTNFKAIEDFSVSPDGSAWMIKGRNQLGSNDETTLVLGAGTTGLMFA